MVKYRPEIDGLRTIAVIPVILFHFGYQFISGGYYGVDVFFVISGYLITGILTESIKEGRFSMFNFWIRRVKRLLPALLVVILSLLIVAPFLVFKPTVKELSEDIFPAMFSYFNFHALYDFGNYWGGKSNNSFFLHVWSLSVEEQFYIIYPFFLFISYKIFNNLAKAIFVVTVLSLFFFIFYLTIDKEFTFYMLPTRVWELAIGGLVAVTNIDLLIKKYSVSIVPKFGALIGISLVGFAYFFGGEILSNAAMLPVLGSAIMIAFCSSNDIVGKLLSTKLFVFIGKLSYSMYLWHWIIIILFRNFGYQLHYINVHVVNLLVIGLTMLLSYATYLFVENKTRNYRHTPKIVIAGIVLISGLAIFFSNYFDIYYKSQYNKLTNYIYYYDISPKQAEIEENNPLDYEVTFLDRPEKFSGAYKNEGIITRINEKDPEIMVLGDSHGVMWAKLLDEVSNDLSLSRSFFTSNGATAFFNVDEVASQSENKFYTESERIEYARAVMNNLEKWNPKLFVMACRWEELRGVNKEYMNSLLSVLENKRIKVLLLTQPPRLSFMTNKNPNQYFTYLGINPTEGFNAIDIINNTEVVNANNYLKSLKTKYQNVSIYDVYESMTENDKVKISLNNDSYYFDDDHLSYPGTFYHKENIKRLFKELINIETNS